MSKEAMQQRISINGIRATDIKRQGLLTIKQIASIEPKNAYDWLRTSQWNYRDFQTWLVAIRDL